MGLHPVLTVNAVLGVLFGIAFLFGPQAVISTYGIQADAVSVYLARLLGAAYLGIGILSWQVRAEPVASRSLALPFAIGNSFAFLAALYQAFIGAGNALRWTSPVIFLFLAVGFWINATRKPASSVNRL